MPATVRLLNANGITSNSGAYSRQSLTSADLDSSRFRANVSGKTRLISDEEMREVHDMMSKLATGEYTNSSILENFNRFYKIFPDMELPSTLTSYVFITRPDLNLYASSRGETGATTGTEQKTTLVADNYNDAFLRYMNVDYPEMLHMLTRDFDSDHDFIPYLQGRTESLQIPDYQIGTSEYTVPMFNYKMPYPGVANESLTGGTFDITFREDDRLRITKMFEFWVYYIDAIKKNKMRPAYVNIKRNRFDFMCSVYQFICDPTSERILFWTKYTGCFPTTVPVSNFSHNLRGSLESKINITFAYMYVEHMQPMIIADFNSNVHASTNQALVPVYDEEFSTTGTTLVGTPVIYRRSNNSSDYYLTWYPRKRGMVSSYGMTSTFGTYYKSDQAALNYISSVRGSNYGYQY